MKGANSSREEPGSPHAARRTLPGLFDADAEDELPLADPGAPGLSDDDPIERSPHRPSGLVEAMEVVQPTDHVAAANASPADDNLLVMAVVGGDDVATGIHDGGALL